MTARFLQVHTLTSFSASLLNRDDSGFAKRMPFGGTIRTRISSQCLKRHWRVFDGEYGFSSIDAPVSVRSRQTFEHYIVEPLIGKGFDPATVRSAVDRLASIVLTGKPAKEAGAKKGKAKGRATADEEAPGQTNGESEALVHTGQVTVLGEPELSYLRDMTERALSPMGTGAAKVLAELDKALKDKDLKANLEALSGGGLQAGLSAALFGRMVTGDLLAQTHAAIHVAHAMTVHAQQTESDYFSAIDDIVRDAGEQGSGHINAAELTSGLFYGYVVVDIPLLLSNLGNDKSLAGNVVERLIRMIATVSPGAKKGSTAPYAYSHLVLAELGKAQPRTLQNAFVSPVRATGDVIQESYERLRDHLSDLDQMYGKTEERAHAGLRSGGHFENGMPLLELAGWARHRVSA